MKLNDQSRRRRRPRITIRMADCVWFTIVVVLASFQLFNVQVQRQALSSESETTMKYDKASFVAKRSLSAPQSSMSGEAPIVDAASSGTQRRSIDQAVADPKEPTMPRQTGPEKKSTQPKESKPHAKAEANITPPKDQPQSAENKEEQVIDKKKPYPYVPGSDYSQVSGCLYIMDDNHYLIEWLAYNYQVYPMRNLFVAVDPKSMTSPKPIFDRYRERGLMNITEWTDDQFYLYDVDPTVNVSDFKDEADQMVERHRYRQHCFYLQCMKAHKQEGRTWTAILDTDEFVLVNQNAKGVFSAYNALQNYPDIKLPSKDPDDDSKSAARLDDPAFKPDSTIADILRVSRREKEKIPELFRQRVVDSPCIMMTRLRFSPKESPEENVNDPRLVPSGYDGKHFMSHRWRWHNGLANLPLNRLGKALVDVSRIPDEELFIKNVYVHRPIMSACFHIKQANFRSAFVGHHYMGTYEQWSFRNDPRKWTRGARDEYELYKVGIETDDSARGWLRDFVHNVGDETARALLKDVGYVPPKEDVYSMKQLSET